MDIRITAVLFFIGATLGVEEVSPANSTHSNVQSKESQLDIFTDLLTQKYAHSNTLKLSEFSSLWAQLISNHNETSPQSASEETQCIKALGQSPICQLMTRVIYLVHHVNACYICLISFLFLFQCSEPKDIFDLLGKTHLDRTGLRNICPLILYQLESGLCQTHLKTIENRPNVKATEPNKKPSSYEGKLITYDFKMDLIHLILF